jgi:glycosyltransferase involved in cell wall biosynthesis
VLWILDELRPRIAARAPHARLTIGGSNPPSWLRARASIAAVPDARAFLRGQAVVIAPLLSGGGMRIKVLEAMSYGCAIVATTRGAGGIEAASGRDLVIADDPDTFADAVVRLLDDPAERRRLGSAARATIRERYDSDRIARDVLAFYATLRP